MNVFPLALLLIFRHESLEIPEAYPAHADIRYFSRARIFSRPATVIFQQPYSVCDVLVYATLSILITYHI